MAQRYIGIVGSRRRDPEKDREIVFGIVKNMMMRHTDVEIVIVSGGCPTGADKFAEEAAAAFSLGKRIHSIPKGLPGENKFQFTNRAFARNREIAVDSQEIYALVHPDRTGGTENTVGHAIDLNRLTYLVDVDGGLFCICQGPP